MSETAIPEDIMRKAYIVATDVLHTISGKDVELIQASSLIDDAIARAILAERESHGWQNIDTVPKDGTIVDLWHVKGFRVVDEWWDAEDGWTGGWLEDQFTHWMKSPIANP